MQFDAGKFQALRYEHPGTERITYRVDRSKGITIPEHKSVRYPDIDLRDDISL